MFLEYAKNLSTHQLTHCQISNLDPLSELTNLFTLVLNNNCLSSVSALSGLSQLSTLDFHDNEITDNEGGTTGAAITLTDSSITLLNCIVWNNTPRDIGLLGTSIPQVTYTRLTDIWSGHGNLTEDPLFACPGFWQQIDGENTDDTDVTWIDGDYHLMSQTGRWDPLEMTWTMDEIDSPCIDAGDPNSAIGDEPQPNGNRINLGAYGGTSQASLSL